jgi:hypothetical protein
MKEWVASPKDYFLLTKTVTFCFRLNQSALSLPALPAKLPTPCST